MMRVYGQINQPRIGGKARGGLNSDSMREHPLRVRVMERSVTRIGVKSSVGRLVIDVQQCSTPGCPECVWPVADPSASGWWQKSPSSKIAPTSAVRAITCRRWSLRSLQLQEFSMKALPNNHDISIPSPLYTTVHHISPNHSPFHFSWQDFSLSPALPSNPRSAEAPQQKACDKHSHSLHSHSLTHLSLLTPSTSAPLPRPTHMSIMGDSRAHVPNPMFPN